MTVSSEAHPLGPVPATVESLAAWLEDCGVPALAHSDGARVARAAFHARAGSRPLYPSRLETAVAAEGWLDNHAAAVARDSDGALVEAYRVAQSAGADELKAVRDIVGVLADAGLHVEAAIVEGLSFRSPRTFPT